MSYSVDLLSPFIQTPRDIHLDCAKRVLRYVSGTMDYDILYKSATLIRLERYTRLQRRQTIKLRVRLLPRQRSYILEQQKAVDSRIVKH